MKYRDKAKAAKKQMDDLLAAAKSDDRVFTDEEKEKFNALQKEYDGCIEMIEAEKKAAAIDDDLQTPAADAGAAPQVTVKKNAPLWPGGLGEKLAAVASAAAPGARVDERLFKNAATGMSEGVPADGGFLLEDAEVGALLTRAYDASKVASRVDRMGLGGNKNAMKFPAIDETSRANGSRSGGVQAYWLAEAGEKTASKPKLRNVSLELNKLIGLCYTTDELLEDTAALEQFVASEFEKEFAFKLDDATINGTGAGIPLGILNSPALVSVAKESGQTADTITYENVLKMWARLWVGSYQNALWYVNQQCFPQLQTMTLAVGTGGQPVYMPPSGAAEAPFGTLFGAPVIPIEQASALGDKGDIILTDMSQYVAIDKGAMRNDSSIHVRFVYDESVFRFVYRYDGRPKWDAALTPYKGTATTSPHVTLDARA